jgi:hypothetical protein
MTGRSRLPGGEPHKAGQKDRVDHFHGDLGDGNAEVTIGSCTYRVWIGDIRPG